MTDRFTFLHALGRSNMNDLKQLAEEYCAAEEIDPKEGKPQFINDLLPHIPEDKREQIIDKTFHKPKARYTAHVGVINKCMPSEKDVNDNCDKFNKSSDYDPDIPEYQTSYKQTINLMNCNSDEYVFYYNLYTKKPEYDFDAMESTTLVYTNKVRILIKPKHNLVTVFTGNRDLFNSILSALTIVLKFAVNPLNANKIGISSITKGNFSFHTLKFLDFIYHGLSDVGSIGSITQVNLETSNKSKDSQKVNVQGGNDLLDDKAICEYLFIYGRDLVGVKLNLNINIAGNEFSANIEIGVRDNRIKIGVKKEKYSIEKVKFFYEVIEKVVYDKLKNPGLIDEGKTIILLDKIRDRAM